MDSTKNWSHGFELLDIEVIPQSKVNEIKTEKWDCDYCSLYFLDEAKLNDHKRKHINTKDENVRCQYCNKPLFVTESSRECYNNRKCETCEYKCSKCPKRFLRHSSLQNHEKNHLRLSSNHKKTVLNNSKPVNSVQVTNKDMKVSKKRQSQLIDDVAEETVDERGKISNKSAIIPKKKSKIDSLKKSFTDETMVDNSNSTKRTSLRSFKQAQQDKPAIIENNKQNRKTAEKEKPVAPLKIKPTTGGATTPIAPIKDNTVNYKPFSCHVCGDTFASDNSLLDHIRSHGESAAKRFKCKHCGDEFDDIYKMQYHLAICPLAEDELECTFQNNIIPPRFIKKEPNNETSPTVKRGRPRKDRSLTSQNSKGEINNICTSSINTSDGLKNKLTDTKLVNKNHNVTKSPTPKKILRRSLNRNVTDKDLDNDRYDANSGDFTEDPRPNEENQHGDSFEFSDTEKKRGYLCPFPGCTIKCSREKALLCHMKNHEDFEESMKCHKCGTTLDDVQSLRLHMNECKGYGEDKDDDSNDDDYRDKSFKSTSKQSAGHYQRHRGQFNCSICGRSYSTQQRLDRCPHEGDPERVITCRLCNFECETEEILQEHLTNTHTNQFPYQCSTCSALFESEEAVSNHMLTHVKDEKKLECVVCSIKLSTYKELYFHYSKDHVKTPESICEICNKTFPDGMTLNEHIMTHKKGRRFQCMFCPKSFLNSAQINDHIKMHTDEKLYKCNQCYRAFLDSRDLFKHMLFHAAGERLLKCCICLEAFRKKRVLKKHIHVTHLENNSSCTECLVCRKIIQQNTKMGLHLLKHSINMTGNNMSKDEIEWHKKVKAKPESERANILLTQKMGGHRKPISLKHSINMTGNNMTEDKIKWRKQAKPESESVNILLTQKMGKHTKSISTIVVGPKKLGRPRKFPPSKYVMRLLQQEVIKTNEKLGIESKEEYVEPEEENFEPKEENVEPKEEIVEPKEENFEPKEENVEPEEEYVELKEEIEYVELEEKIKYVKLKEYVEPKEENVKQPLENNTREDKQLINGEHFETVNDNFYSSEEEGNKHNENSLMKSNEKRSSIPEEEQLNITNAMRHQSTKFCSVKITPKSSTPHNNNVKSDKQPENKLNYKTRSKSLDKSSGEEDITNEIEPRDMTLNVEKKERPMSLISITSLGSGKKSSTSYNSSEDSITAKIMKEQSSILGTITVQNSEDTIIPSTYDNSSSSQHIPTKTSQASSIETDENSDDTILPLATKSLASPGFPAKERQTSPIETGENFTAEMKYESETLDENPQEINSKNCVSESFETKRPQISDSETDFEYIESYREDSQIDETDQKSNEDTLQQCSSLDNFITLENGHYEKTETKCSINKEDINISQCNNESSTTKSLESKTSVFNERKRCPSESDNSKDWIREKKYFEPSLRLSKYSCTTCVLSFSNQEELLSHNTQHIF